MPRLAYCNRQHASTVIFVPQATSEKNTSLVPRTSIRGAKLNSQLPEIVKAMSQPEDDSICLACDFILRNNRDTGYSHKSSALRPFDGSDDLEGI
jgi:hypothetical protein